MTATSSCLTLADRPDREDLSDSFHSQGRVHIPHVLTEESAEIVYHCLVEQPEWNLVYNLNGEHVDVSANAVAKWPLKQRQKLSRLIYQQARKGFQYCYKAIPIYDIYHRKLLPEHFFNELFEFLNGEEFLSLARGVTGFTDIGFCDAQATCYEREHFLTAHDDNVKGKGRLAAYVLNLTPTWRTDWGGALQFTDPQDNPIGAFRPSYNALNLFRVPQRHAVEFVTPFAPAPRFAITGWLRSGTDPGG